MQDLAIILSVLWFATFVRTVVGFGDAMIAMPLLSLFFPPEIATPLVGLVAATTSIGITLQSWRDIDMAAVWRLVVASIVALPFGLVFLKSVAAHWFYLGLAIILVGHSILQLTHPTLLELKANWWAYPFGFVAGALGAAYNTNGPPIVLYASLVRWDPVRFRATIQGYFLPIGLSILISQGLAGLWTETILLHYATAAPGVLVLLPIGRWLHQELQAKKFVRIVLLLLFVMGILMLGKSVMQWP